MHLNNCEEEKHVQFHMLTVWPHSVQSWPRFVSVALMELSYSGFITGQSSLLFRLLYLLRGLNVG